MEESQGDSQTHSTRFTEEIPTPYHAYSPDLPAAPDYESNPGAFVHRLSQKEHLPSSRLDSPGLESVWDGEGAKEVVPTETQHHHQQYYGDLPPGFFAHEGNGAHNNEREYFGLSRKRFFLLIIFAILLIIAVGLGVGLGVESSMKDNKDDDSQPVNTEYLIGGAIDPSYFSDSGAFNGSGIALASQSFSSDLEDGTQGISVIYFQHHTGEIRWTRLDPDGSWVGGSVSEVVATDAKNSTPLSAVAYSINDVDTWHIFYIDNNNMIKERINSNKDNFWSDGPINKAKLYVNDADQVGMQACWYGSDYGDSDYEHTPLPNQDNDSAASEDYGMHLWYASDNDTFQQLGWREGDEVWAHQGSFENKNGHAGVGCYSWAKDSTVTYVMFVNADNEVEFYWKDTNTNRTGTANHPINEWTKAPISIPGVHPSTSLGYTNYFYAQAADTHLFNGYNISWAAENTTISDKFTVEGEPGLPGTHLTVSAIPNASKGNDIVVFYQVEGNDITEYTRDLVAGQWTSVDIEVPQN